MWKPQIKSFFHRLHRSATTSPSEDSFARQRRLIEEFHEDYLPWDDRIKLWLSRAIAFIVPFVAVLAVGSSLGAFFAPAYGAFSSYLIAYALEAIIAALTIALGMAMQAVSAGAEHWTKVAIATCVWFIISLASGFGLYLVASMTLSAAQPGFADVAIGIRTGAVMLLDVGSVCILFFRGKALKQYLKEMAQKREAIIAANAAEVAITRAQDDAEMRRVEEEQFLESRRRSYELVNRLQEITSAAIIEAAKEGLLKGQAIPLAFPQVENNGRHPQSEGVFRDSQK